MWMAGLERAGSAWSRGGAEFLLAWTRLAILFLNRFLLEWPRLRPRCPCGAHFEYGMGHTGDIRSLADQIVYADGIYSPRSVDSPFSSSRIHGVFSSLFPSSSKSLCPPHKRLNRTKGFSMYIQVSYIVQYSNTRAHTEIAIVGPRGRALDCIYRVGHI